MKISNSYAFNFNPNFILIMGGITKKVEPAATKLQDNSQGNYMAQSGLNSAIVSNEMNKTFEI